jgi:hypothetical protein
MFVGLHTSTAFIGVLRDKTISMDCTGGLEWVSLSRTAPVRQATVGPPTPAIQSVWPLWPLSTFRSPAPTSRNRCKLNGPVCGGR